MKVLAERLPLTPIFQNMTFIHYVQRLANVTTIAKFNLHSTVYYYGESDVNIFFLLFCIKKFYNAHLNDLPVKFSVCVNEGQDKLPTM